jgi:hypothetical protein
LRIGLWIDCRLILIDAIDDVGGARWRTGSVAIVQRNVLVVAHKST